ncbi:MAG TPA: TIGR03086 family metal-binding protein [Pseudonocardia sp.]|nr:TIGR03086 family metal-binding protein [Pseudonocardia sp.]
MDMIDTRPLHQRALKLATTVVDRVGPADATRGTPCPPWDLHALLAHMIGQNHGFATAIAGPGDAPLDAFAPRPPAPDPAAEWAASAELLTRSFAGADLARPVLLPEISAEYPFPAGVVIGFHLLDTVVHGWDVATALGVDYQPDDELVDATLRVAQFVPTGPAREEPGAAFAPVLPAAADTAPWPRTLALLGRAAR